MDEEEPEPILCAWCETPIEAGIRVTYEASDGETREEWYCDGECMILAL